MSTEHRPHSRVKRASKNPVWPCVELPVTSYGHALGLQHRVVAAKNRGMLEPDLLFILEHPPTFTLGRRGGRQNLIVPDAAIERSGIRILKTERGGDITYHGPGQVVAYPIVDLSAARLGVADYVDHLEEVMIRTARAFGVAAKRSPLNRGVWVGKAKLGSVGIALRHNVSFHGFALNVNLSLAPFEWINPCGLPGIAMTSLERERSHPISAAEARDAVKRNFESVFDIELTPARMEDLPVSHPGLERTNEHDPSALAAC